LIVNEVNVFLVKIIQTINESIAQYQLWHPKPQSVLVAFNMINVAMAMIMLQLVCIKSVCTEFLPAQQNHNLALLKSL